MTFLLATPVLIGLLIIFIILISAMVEMENSGWATTFFSISIVLLFWHYWSDIWGWIAQNPADTFIFIGGYIVGGVIWSIIKWKSYISGSARHFEYLKNKFIAEVGQIGANWNKWISVLNKNSHKLNNSSFYEKDEPGDIIKKLTISANEKKSVIVSWIAYWPMSIAATLLNDPIRRLMSYIYDRISGIFQRMSNNSAKSLSKGMDKYGPEHQDSK
jgi:hypothetical protein